MLVLSSPSGAGKTTISREILRRDGNLVMSVSVTTRSKRPAEVDGKDYIFVDDAAFEKMVCDGAFLEHAAVFGHKYGTPRAEVEKALRIGRDVLFDVDWQGTQQLRQSSREDLVGVFVLPPSVEELERRLRSRAQDSEDVVRKRMSKAAIEMSHYMEYDYILVNTDVNESVANVEAILWAERLRRKRQPGLPDFLRSLGVGS